MATKANDTLDSFPPIQIHWKQVADETLKHQILTHDEEYARENQEKPILDSKSPIYTLDLENLETQLASRYEQIRTEINQNQGLSEADLITFKERLTEALENIEGDVKLHQVFKEDLANTLLTGWGSVTSRGILLAFVNAISLQQDGLEGQQMVSHNVHLPQTNDEQEIMATTEEALKAAKFIKTGDGFRTATPTLH